MTEELANANAEEGAASLEEATAIDEGAEGADEAPRETPSYVAPGYEVVPAGALSASVATLSSPWISGGSSGGGSGSGSGSGGGSGTGSGSGGDTSASARFKRVLTGHFGFDGNTADIMLRVLSSIESLASSLNDADKHLKAAYVFFRALSGVSYATPKWDLTAGDLNAVYKGFLLDQMIDVGQDPPESFFVKLVGISQDQYLHLWYELDLQHTLSGRTKSGASLLASPSLSNLNRLNSFKDDYKKAYHPSEPNAEIDDNVFRSFWNRRASAMCAHPDFTHFCATVATHLGLSLGYGLVAEAGIYAAFDSAVYYLGSAPNACSSFAGWLGDAVLTSSRRADGDRDGVADDPSSPEYEGTSFGWDDYWADIDALHVAKTLPANAYDVKLTLASYYGVTSSTSPATCFARRNYFTRYYSADTAAKCVAFILPSHTVVSNISEAISVLEGYPGYYDTYRFLLTLNGAAEGTYGGSEI